MEQAIDYKALHCADFCILLLLLMMMIMIMIVIMSMAWGYVFEMRPQTDLFFIPQIIYDYVEPWWDDIDRGKLIRPTNLSGNPTSRII
jgi:hypothetical protein